MKKKTFLWIGACILLLLAGLFFLRTYLENRIESKIREAGGKNLEVGNIEVSLLQRQVKLQDVTFRKGGKVITAPEVELEGIQFLEVVSSDNFIIRNVSVQSPDIVYYPQADSLNSAPEVPGKIRIDNFEVSDGSFRSKKSDSVRLFFEFPKFTLSEVIIDSTTIRSAIPFDYESYAISGDSLMVTLGPLHSLSVGKVEMTPEEFVAKDLRIIPFEDKINFQKKLEYEKDRIVLNLQEMRIGNLEFEFVNDSLQLKSPEMTLSGGNLEIYRNRLLPDSPEEKMMYSELLRKAPIKLAIDEVQVNNSQIIYEEKIVASKPAAKIGFYDVNGSIKNLTNMHLERENFPRTKVSANASFMNVAPLNIDYSFNVGTRPTRFTISGDFGSVPGEVINRYLRLARNKKVEGKIQTLAFTFSGDEYEAVGDVRVVYDNFKVIILEDGGEEKNEIFTFFANLFVDNDGNEEHNGAFVVKDVKVERDDTKSFWSYIWSGIQKGLMEAVKQL